MGARKESYACHPGKALQLLWLNGILCAHSARTSNSMPRSFHGNFYCLSMRNQCFLQLVTACPCAEREGRYRDSTVFSVSNFTWVRFKSSVSDTVGKFVDGITFVSRGFRLLGSDVTYGGRLVYRVALGKSSFICYPVGIVL